MIELDTIKIPTLSHTTLSPTICSSTVAARKHQNDVSSDHRHRLDKLSCVGDDLFYSHQMDNKLTWGDEAPMYHHINKLFQLNNSNNIVMNHGYTSHATQKNVVMDLTRIMH